MKKLLTNSKRILTGALAALLVLTSFPDATLVALAATDEMTIEEGVIVEEEVFEEGTGDVIEPDAYTDDATINVADYDVAPTDLAGIFVVNGSTATQKDDDNIVYDSDDDQDIYIAPAKGYKLASEPFTLSASWKKTASSDTVTYANYTAAKTAGIVSEISSADISGTNISSSYDGSKAIKVTFKAGSPLATAFAENKVEAYTSGPTVSLDLQASASNQAEAVDVPVFVYEPGVTTFGSGKKINGAKYDADWTGTGDAGISIVGSSFDWTGVTAEVGILKGFDEENEAEWDTAAWTVTTFNTDWATTINDLKSNTSTDSYYLADGKIAINEKGINDSYSASLTDGYELAVVLTRSEAAVAKVHNFTATESDYYEIEGTTVTAKKVTEASTGAVYVQADVTTGSIVGHNARALSKVYYKVGSADAVQANDIAASDIDDEYKITGETAALDDDSKDEAAAAANAAGWRKIAKSALTDDTVVYATTKETINFNGIKLNGSNSTVTVTTENASTLENEAVAISPAITKGNAYSNNAKTTSLTGKPYSFKVVPASGYEVTEVVAKVYGINGVGFDNIDLTGKGVNGVYTIDSVTANIDITVNTAELGAQAATISLTADPTGAGVVLSATGEPISASEAPSIKTGTDVSFEATVLPGYWIKKLEYKVGATGEVTTLEPASISPKGVFSYTIPAAKVTGQVNLTFTMDDTSAAKRNSVKILKYPNSNATITVDGVELKDAAEYMIVPTSEELTFTVAGVGDAVVDKVYYQAVSDVASNGGISDTSSATPLGGTRTFAIATETLAGSDRDGTKGIYLIATTKEEVATSEYKVLWDGTAKPNDVDTTKGETLTEVKLVAGGTDTEDAITDEASKSLKNIDIKASDTITATVVKASDGKTPIGGVATATYALGITGTNAVAAKTSTSTITSTNKSGEDVLSVEFATTSTFPHTKTYSSSIPVTVTPLNTVYATEGLSLKTAVASKGTPASTVAKAGLDATGTTIRVQRSTAPAIDDFITLNPQFIDENANGTENKNNILVDAGGANDTFIKTITWVAVSATGEKYDPDFLAPTYTLYPNYNGSTTAYTGATSNSIDVATPSATQSITVTGTITYLDDTTSTVQGVVNVIDDNLGYIGIPVITVGGQDAVYNGASPIAALELATANGLNSATIKYEVYEVLSNTTVTSVATVGTFNTLTEATIKSLVEGKELKPVTSGIDFGKGLKKTVSSDPDAVTGISAPAADGTFTLTAAKAGTINLKPDFSVNGVPVAVTTTAIAVTVVDALPTFTVTLNTDYTTSAKTADYDAPDLKTGAAWLAKAHGTTLGTTKKTPTAYTYKNVTAGTKVTLPTFEDFNIKTFDPKKVLWAWTDNGATAGVGHSFAPGETITISGNTTFTPVWVNKYQGGNVYGTIGSGKANITSSTDIAVDAKLPVYIKYNALDEKARADAVEAGTFDGAVAYKSTADYVTDGMKLSWTTESDKASIIENGTVITAADAGGADPVLKVEYVEFEGAENKVTYTPAGSTNTTTFAVATAEAYSMTVDAITVEENQVKGVAVDLKRTTGGASTAVALNNTTYLTATASDNLKVKVVDETVAKVEVDDSNNNLKVTGLKAGGSTTVTLTLTDNKGTVVVSDPIAISVGTATRKIVAATESTDTALWDDTYGMLVDRGTSAKTLTFAIETIATGAKVPGTGWTVTDSTPDTVVTARNIYDSGNVPTFSGNVLSYTPLNKFGQAMVDVTATVDGNTYLATVPVTSMYRYTYVFNDTTTDIYEGETKATANIVKPVIYTGSETYTIPKSNEITAKWTGAGTLEFFGWGTTFKSNGTVADADAYLAGESYTIEEADLAATTLHAVLGTPSISVTGLPTEIVLTDETLASATAAGTDVIAYSLSITPATSASPVTITADKKAFVSLNHGDATKVAVATRNTYDGSAPTTAGTGPAPGNGIATTDKGGVSNEGLLNGTAADGTTTTSRIFTFTVGTANPAVPGTGNLLVGYNGKTTKIPVYVNGEYTDTTVTPNVVRYLEKGENLESGVRTVNGEKHYYKDGVKVLKGAVKIDTGADAGKTVLIVNGKVYTTVGAMAIEDKVYYVGTDGFVKTSGLFNGEATSDKDKSYFANEDGTLVAGELKEVSGKTYYFNGTGVMEKAASTANAYALSSDGKYYVNKSGEVAVSGIFKVEGKDRLFRADGTIVKYTDADVINGKITVDSVGYVISSDDTAKRDDVFYNAKVNWVTKFASTWSKSDPIPTVTYTITYTSANTGATTTTESLNAIITPATVASDATEVTFVATASLAGYFQDKEGTKAAVDETISKTYRFKNGGSAGSSGTEIAAEAGITIEGLEEEYAWTGTAIQPAFKVVDNTADKTLAKGVDYTVKFANNKNVGTATVTVTGKGNYAGANSTASFTIVDPMKDVEVSDLAGIVKKISKPAAMTYTGEPLYPSSLTVTLKDNSTVTLDGDGNGGYSNSSGKDLVVSISNNINKGNATVAITGSDGKTKKTTFKINPAAITSLEDSDISVAEEAEFRVKGATPVIALAFNGEDLVEGQDYTAKYKNNKKAGSATVTISGKGNFSSKLADKTFTVTPLSLADCTFDAATVFEGTKATAIKATVLDPNGDALKVKTHYTLAATPDSDGGVDSKGKLVAGKDVEVVATAAGSDIEASTTASKTFTVGYNLAKAKVAITKGFAKTYTGSAVVLEAEDWSSLTVTIKAADKTTKTLKVGEDFVVAGYTNNLKKGSMTVTIAGTGTATENGTFSGVKTFKVKINAKPITK